MTKSLLFRALTIVIVTISVFAIRCETSFAQGQPSGAAAKASSDSSTSPQDNDVVAVVNGRKITLSELDERAGLQLYNLQQKIYTLRIRTLEDLILRMSLEEEARRKGVSVDQLKSSLAASPVEVKQADIDKIYVLNASQFANVSEDEAKEKIRMDLEQRAKLSSYRAAINAIRSKLDVHVLLRQPTPPTVNLSAVGPFKGPADAPVTIIEFSDFQCPFCKQLSATIKQLLDYQKGKIKLVFKQYPLPGHQYAFKAAQAAVCAGEQEKFWQYHDVLFENSNDLSIEALKRYALMANLDAGKFNQCLDSESSQAAVLKDMQEGIKAGISATPTFLINGVVLQGTKSLEDLKVIVDEALRSSGRTEPGQIGEKPERQ